MSWSSDIRYLLGNVCVVLRYHSIVVDAWSVTAASLPSFRDDTLRLSFSLIRHRVGYNQTGSVFPTALADLVLVQARHLLDAANLACLFFVH